MKIAPENNYNAFNTNKENTNLLNLQPNKTKNKYGFYLEYGSEKISNLNLSTRIYAEKVIKTAIQNIKSGENIAENERLIQIFAPFVNEIPQKIIYG